MRWLASLSLMRARGLLFPLRRLFATALLVRVIPKWASQICNGTGGFSNALSSLASRLFKPH